MTIITIRRISQSFFLILFLWFTLVTTIGHEWWRLRGWPVNWLIQLDPLVGLGNLLTTHTVYKGLLWGLGTVVLTIVLGRFFCSWICPFGSMHHFTGWLVHRKKSVADKVKANRYRKAQSIKYWILTFLLTGAVVHLVSLPSELMRNGPWLFWMALVSILAFIALLSILEAVKSLKNAVLLLVGISAAWIISGLFFPEHKALPISLQTGLLDPIPLVYRSINLSILPLIDAPARIFSTNIRYYHGAFLIGAVFLSAVFLNILIPRFYCRFICPLGALFGVLGRFSFWRIGKNEAKCPDCLLCDAGCEGGCEPSAQIRTSECVLCMNCLHVCKPDLIGFKTAPSASGEITAPDVSRRAFLTSFISGVAAVPLIRLEGITGANWHPDVIRPPGAISEEMFLSRCIKCGQCMRVCPTNIIHPSGIRSGIEGLWTPVLNFRIGTSGCQLNCVACGHLCPTSAIRPISLNEKLGLNEFKGKGPVRLGTAFVDQGRCLPWAMDRPCIVCQENCPVSPKAISTKEHYSPIKVEAQLRVKTAGPTTAELKGSPLPDNKFATGDYYCSVSAQGIDQPRLIIKNTSNTVTVSPDKPWVIPPKEDDMINIMIRLQRPFVDPSTCIGCGICEHECPVRIIRAIRVSAENETRNRDHSLLLPSSAKKQP
ncbi:4Fe-4S binding protein [Thermodesulfobacteriota bacterium]